MHGGTLVMIVGDAPWYERVLAQCPRKLSVDHSATIPAELDGNVRLIILQPDRVPSADDFKSLRRPGGPRWICCGDNLPTGLAKDIDIELRTLSELKAVLETRFEPPVPINESSPEDQEFRRGIEKDVFAERIFDYANRTLKNWEARIKPGQRAQGENMFDDRGFQHHLNRFHHLLSHSFELLSGPVPTDGSKQVARLFESIYVTEKTVVLARRHFETNTPPQYEWPAVRTGVDRDTLVCCHEGFLMALLIVILASAPEAQITSVTIDATDAQKIRLTFPFAFMLPDDGAEAGSLGLDDQRESLAKILRKHQAEVDWNETQVVLILRRHNGTP